MSGSWGAATVEHGRALLDEIVARVQELCDLEYPKVLDADVLDLCRRTELVARLVGAAQVAQVDEIEQRGVARARGCTSTAVLLQEMLRIPKRDAVLRVKTAKAIHAQDLPSGGETPPVRPILGAAVSSGLVDPDHVDTILGTMKRLPSDLDVDTVVMAERALVGHATQLNPDQFRKVAHRLEESLNQDGSFDEREPLSKVEFHIGSRCAATGLTSISGKLDDLSTEVLRTVIDSLSAPRPEVDGVKDPRPAPVRRAHALIEALNQSLTHKELPAHGGERPHVTVTLDWDVLKQQIGHAVTDHGTTLSPATTRRLLCDATIIPAVLNGHSEVLDLGRSSRTFNRAMRRAITTRDKGCAFPGCDRPPALCECHHVSWWVRDLGDTSYHNGCLLCAFHHTEIHNNEWRIRMAPDGVPEFIPPPWIDVEQRQRRNTVHSLTPTVDW